jgi:nickel/cobalt transporter (NicO) family protein
VSPEILLLVGTAAAIAFVHTLIGPDHYLPFIVLSRARRWSAARTVWITLLCGTGHVLSSVVLGLVGIALGIGVGRLESIESARGELAAWALIAVGLAYFAWGLRRALRQRGHRHFHFPSRDHLRALEAQQAGGLAHDHGAAPAHHHHGAERHHDHAHIGGRQVSLTPWALFIVFALGPCEPLIPVLMYPAAVASWWGVVLVTGVFGGVTLATMLGAVWVGSRGLDLVPLGALERYSHALAGAAIVLSGLGVQLLGL